MLESETERGFLMRVMIRHGHDTSCTNIRHNAGLIFRGLHTIPRTPPNPTNSSIGSPGQPTSRVNPKIGVKGFICRLNRSFLGFSIKTQYGPFFMDIPESCRILRRNSRQFWPSKCLKKNPATFPCLAVPPSPHLLPRD